MKLNEYISNHESGSSLAAKIGVPQSLISQWKCGSRAVPAERCLTIEKETNGLVRCEDLRPDVDWAYLRGTATVNAEISPIPENREAA